MIKILKVNFKKVSKFTTVNCNHSRDLNPGPLASFAEVLTITPLGKGKVAEKNLRLYSSVIMKLKFP